MLPTIAPGCTVTLRSRAFSELAAGDVIAFEQHATLLVHRIIEVTADGVLTAGDNNILLDEPVTERDYLGWADLSAPHPDAESDHREAPRRTPLTVWIPHGTRPPTTGTTGAHATYTVRYFTHPQEVLQHAEPAGTIGISPRGIWNEARLVRELRRGSATDLVCFANFGPNEAPYFPGRACAGIARLNLPSSAATEPGDAATLSYLHQLLHDTRGTAHG